MSRRTMAPAEVERCVRSHYQQLDALYVCYLETPTDALRDRAESPASLLRQYARQLREVAQQIEEALS